MKNGFTLIELIMVITLLGIIALIAVPAILGSTKNSKEQAYNEQKRVIVSASKQYMASNSLYYSKVPCTVSVSTLQEDGFLSNKDIVNPLKRNENFEGVVEVLNENGTYTYTYLDISSYSECKEA